MTAVLDTLVAVRRTAMDLLARREHGRVELTRKLRQRGAEAEMIETALDRLTEEGLLSEARYLESFVSYRARSGYGPCVFAKSWASVVCNAPISNSPCVSGIDWQEQLRTPGSASSPDIYRLMPRNVPNKVVPRVSGLFDGDDQPLVQRQRDGRLSRFK
jgi:hypothetical protein